MERGDLRGRTHEVFERGEDFEQPVGNQLKVAVTKVVHEVKVSFISSHGNNGVGSGDQHRRQWDCKQRKIHQVFSKRMNYSCQKTEI